MNLSQTEIDRNDVTMAFRLLLGRDPESEETITAHLGLGNLAELRRAIMASTEFQSALSSHRFRESKWVATDVLDGYTMWVDLHDRYVSHGCLHNDWEAEETAFFRSRLRPGSVVLDIGANIGWFSLVAAKHIGSHGVVHAFEPRPVTSRMLHRTVADNRLQDIIHVWEYALDDQSSELELTWQTGTDNPGGSHLNPTVEANGLGYDKDVAKVTGCRLDDLLPDVAPDVVKIDVEGAEPRVIAGARRALARKRPVVLSELFPEQLRNVSGSSPSAYIALMESLGYGCYLLERGEPGRRLRDFPEDANRELVSVVFERRVGF